MYQLREIHGINWRNQCNNFGKSKNLMRPYSKSKWRNPCYYNYKFNISKEWLRDISIFISDWLTRQGPWVRQKLANATSLSTRGFILLPGLPEKVHGSPLSNSRSPQPSLDHLCNNYWFLVWTLRGTLRAQSRCARQLLCASRSRTTQVWLVDFPTQLVCFLQFDLCTCHLFL